MSQDDHLCLACFKMTVYSSGPSRGEILIYQQLRICVSHVSEYTAYIWHKDVISTLEVSRQTKRSLLVLFQYKSQNGYVSQWSVTVISRMLRVRSRSFKSRLWQ